MCRLNAINAIVVVFGTAFSLSIRQLKDAQIEKSNKDVVQRSKCIA